MSQEGGLLSHVPHDETLETLMSELPQVTKIKPIWFAAFKHVEFTTIKNMWSLLPLKGLALTESKL